MSELGERAVRCAGWRWLPGMAALGPGWFRVLYVGDGYISGSDGDTDRDADCADGDEWWYSSGGYKSELLPDLEDAGTLGFVLKLVREAWGAPCAQISPQVDITSGKMVGWRYFINDVFDGEHAGRLCKTEAEALVAALEAAPGAK